MICATDFQKSSADLARDQKKFITRFDKFSIIGAGKSQDEIMSKRDDQIIELVHKYGELSVQELSDLLGISPSTIRRDLVSVGDHRFIGRTHGGVTLATVINYQNLCVNRVAIDPREVRSIASRAADMVHPGDVVGLSGGEICTYLAYLLRMKEDITVVTNAINIAVELVCLPGIQVRLNRRPLKYRIIRTNRKEPRAQPGWSSYPKILPGNRRAIPGLRCHRPRRSRSDCFPRYDGAYSCQYCLSRQPKI